MTLSEKQRQLIEEYGFLPDPQERFSYLMELSQADPGLEASERHPTDLVAGCMSQVWVIGEEREGHLFFRSDSDAPMVKALAWLLTSFYSGAEPEEIAATEPVFLRELNLLHALTENRRRGALNIVARIKQIAQRTVNS